MHSLLPDLFPGYHYTRVFMMHAPLIVQDQFRGGIIINIRTALQPSFMPDGGAVKQHGHS